MPLESEFSVSANQSWGSGYSTDSPDDPYLQAWLSSFGGYTGAASALSLPEQHGTDTLVIGVDAASPTDEDDITHIGNQLLRRACFSLLLNGTNVTEDHQYLLVFGFKRFNNVAMTVQFFVGNEWVHSEPLSSDTEDNVALLLDTPGPGWVQVYARLASASNGSVLGLTGVQGYIL